MSLQEGSHYMRNHQYTPGSGRRQQAVLPGTSSYGRDDTSHMNPVNAATHRFEEGDFVPPGFFQMVSPELFRIPNSSQDWKYSMRREAQQILPFLCLGPWACLKDRAWMGTQGFTLLLAVRDKRLAQVRLVSGEKAATELGIESDTVDIVDNQELISTLPRAVRRINDHILSHSMTHPGSPPKVFIFCETGNGLSAVVVIAYIMVMLNADLPQAIQAVHAQRFCIETDEESRVMLGSFESILAAKGDVEQTRRASRALSVPLSAPRSTSRKRDMDYRREDETMGDAMNVDEGGSQSEPRQFLGPFQDR